MIFYDDADLPYVAEGDGELVRVSACHEAPLEAALLIPAADRLATTLICTVCGVDSGFGDLTPNIDAAEHRRIANEYERG